MDHPVTISAFVGASMAHFHVDLGMAGPGALQPLSICDQVRDRLRLSPETLLRPFYEDARIHEDRLGRDPEGQVLNGLAAVMRYTLSNYQHCISPDTAIRLLIVDDGAQNAANSRFSNLINVLLGGLYADGEHDVAFVA